MLLYATEFPDDDNFRVYRVWKKHQLVRDLAAYKKNMYIRSQKQLSIFCKSTWSYLHPFLSKAFWGSESYRGGTKTSATAAVTGKNAKKALGSMLDTSVAELAVKEKDLQPTAKAKGKAKAKSTPKPKGGSPEEKAKKDLMKDIKAFFGKKTCRLSPSCLLCCPLNLWLLWTKAQGEGKQSQGNCPWSDQFERSPPRSLVPSCLRNCAIYSQCIFFSIWSMRYRRFFRSCMQGDDWQS